MWCFFTDCRTPHVPRNTVWEAQSTYVIPCKVKLASLMGRLSGQMAISVSRQGWCSDT